MAKDPAFLFYTGDFSTGTQFFTDEQVGKYIRLMMAQHQHGHLSEKQMIFICKSYDEDVFSKFTKDENGLFFNERLEYEISRRQSYVSSRSANKAGKVVKKEEKLTHKKNIQASYDNHMENENENKTIIKNKRETVKKDDSGFDEFWNLYDKKVGKEKSIREWLRLTEIERVDAITYIPAYKLSKEEKKFRKDPERFLRNKTWLDEIIKPENKPYINGNNLKGTTEGLASKNGFGQL